MQNNKILYIFSPSPPGWGRGFFVFLRLSPISIFKMREKNKGKTHELAAKNREKWARTTLLESDPNQNPHIFHNKNS